MQSEWICWLFVHNVKRVWCKWVWCDNESDYLRTSAENRDFSLVSERNSTKFRLNCWDLPGYVKSWPTNSLLNDRFDSIPCWWTIRTRWERRRNIEVERNWESVIFLWNRENDDDDDDDDGDEHEKQMIRRLNVNDLYREMDRSRTRLLASNIPEECIAWARRIRYIADELSLRT